MELSGQHLDILIHFKYSVQICSKLVVLDILVPIYAIHVPFNISPECYLFLYFVWQDWTKTLN